MEERMENVEKTTYKWRKEYKMRNRIKNGGSMQNVEINAK